MMAAVRTSGKGSIELPASSRNLASKLVPIEGKPLHFKIKGVDDVEYWPYFEIQEEDFSCFPKLSGR